MRASGESSEKRLRARGWLVSRTLLNPFFVAGLKARNYRPFEEPLPLDSIFRPSQTLAEDDEPRKNARENRRVDFRKLDASIWI